VVTSVSAIVLVVALATAGGQPDTEKVTVSVLSVQATNEGRSAQRDETANVESKPKRSTTAPYLQQGFAPGLRDKPKPKKQGNGDRRYFEAGLESIRDAAATLPYDTYKKIKSESSNIAFGKESQFEINGRYTLRLTPLDRDSQGRLRIKVSVDEKSVRDGNQHTVTAVETTSAIAPNKYLVLGGRLPLDEGQLVIFVGAKP
jgi:hypothetical protein